MGMKEFQVISKLGEGSFSSVWKVKRISDGQEYAMKKVKLASLCEKEKQNALNEVRILASIKNPYIIGYKEAFFEDNSMTLCIVMEYAGGGDIYNKIIQHQKSRTFFLEEQIWNYAIQMIIGLKTLHDMKILHRDLKSANIFVSTDGQAVKLGDLNVSKVAKTNLVYTQTGTPYYASPEVWRDQPYDLKSDIWSLGCVIYEMCALKPPFRANDMPGLNKRIQKGIYEKIPSHYSVDLSNLIAMCLQVSPSSRPNCDKLLTHPILLRHGEEFIQNLDQIFGENQLLGTIQLPRNIKALADKLPKPNYEEAQSEELEKGNIVTESNERELYRAHPQRAYSQQGNRIQEEKPIIRKLLSREAILPSRQKISISNGNLEPHRIKLEQPERIVLKKGPSPRGGEKIQNSKVPSNKDISVRKLAGPLENYVLKKKSKNNNQEVISNLKVPKKEIENVYQNLQIQKPRLYSREKQQLQIEVSDDKGLSEQEYLINKYLLQNQGLSNRANEKVSERLPTDLDDIIYKRAENIVKKYYADAAMVEKREPLRRVNGTPANEALNILERYNNIYNLHEPKPSSRVVSGKRTPYQQINHSDNNVNNDYKLYQNNQNAQNAQNLGNKVNFVRQQQLQLRGVVRPNWWG